jgi:5-methylcytosine-specific restriction endonuclease McrA
MPNVRRRANVLDALTTLSRDEHDQLKVNGAGDKKYWDAREEPGVTWVTKFRSEVKSYYYYRQGRMCCYCSKELDSHNGAFDAEHILDKDTHPQFMFDLANISAACKTCNGAKGKKGILAGDVLPSAIPIASDAYRIVHPHIDEWSEFLDFDSIGRIVAKQGKTKGTETIQVCGIHYLNSARLADHFLPADNAAAEAALDGFFRVRSRTWKRKYLRILRKMVDEYELASACAIVDLLEEETNREFEVVSALAQSTGNGLLTSSSPTTISLSATFPALDATESFVVPQEAARSALLLTSASTGTSPEGEN